MAEGVPRYPALPSAAGRAAESSQVRATTSSHPSTHAAPPAAGPLVKPGRTLAARFPAHCPTPAGSSKAAGCTAGSAAQHAPLAAKRRARDACAPSIRTPDEAPLRRPPPRRRQSPDRRSADRLPRQRHSHPAGASARQPSPTGPPRVTDLRCGARTPAQPSLPRVQPSWPAPQAGAGSMLLRRDVYERNRVSPRTTKAPRGACSKSPGARTPQWLTYSCRRCHPCRRHQSRHWSCRYRRCRRSSCHCRRCRPGHHRHHPSRSSVRQQRPMRPSTEPSSGEANYC